MPEHRQYLTFYGIDYRDWYESFGSFVNHHKLLVEQYISDGVGEQCVESVPAHGTHKFIYPHHLQKTYFVEGRIEGHITIATEGVTGICEGYRVSICKVHEDATETELASTGWVSVNAEIEWDSTYDVSDERVFHFWIDCWQEQEVIDLERIYVKVQFRADPSIIFLHSNDDKWRDLWVEIPFKM